MFILQLIKYFKYIQIILKNIFAFKLSRSHSLKCLIVYRTLKNTDFSSSLNNVTREHIHPILIKPMNTIYKQDAASPDLKVSKSIAFFYLSSLIFYSASAHPFSTKTSWILKMHHVILDNLKIT